MTEDYINFIIRDSVPKAMKIEAIAQATDLDRVLKGLPAAIHFN